MSKRLKEAEGLLRQMLNECDLRGTYFEHAMLVEHFLGEHKDEPEKNCDECISARMPRPKPRKDEKPARKVKYVSFADIAAVRGDPLMLEIDGKGDTENEA